MMICKKSLISIFFIMMIFVVNLILTVKAEVTADHEWESIFGGEGYEAGNDVIQTSEGGYIIVGGTLSYGSKKGYNLWLIKTDENGREQWNKTFGGLTEYGGDIGYSIQQTSDGGYIIGGQKSGWDDVWLIKTDVNGDMTWNRTYRTVNYTSDDVCYSIRQTTDAGYILTGSARGGYYSDSFESNIWLIKTDADGNKEWDKLYGDEGSDVGRCIEQTSDGGYILAGHVVSLYKTPSANDEFYLLKTDSHGDKEWSEKFGGVYSDKAYFVQQTTDGGYILVGESERRVEDSDYWDTDFDILIIKTDANGTLLWEKRYGGEGHEDGKYIQQTSDGGYIVVGKTRSYQNLNRGGDILVIKTASDGGQEWDKIFGRNDTTEYGSSIKQTDDGGYIIVGTTNALDTTIPVYNDILLLKIGSGPFQSDSEIYGVNIDKNQEQDESSQTPGFELIIFFITIALIVFWKRK